jgi:hypothetical protein
MSVTSSTYRATVMPWLGTVPAGPSPPTGQGGTVRFALRRGKGKAVRRRLLNSNLMTMDQVAINADFDFSEPCETFVMQDTDKQRTEELNQLRLALATFALQLDAFEARLRRRLTKTNVGPSTLASPPDIRFEKQVIGAKNHPACQVQLSIKHHSGAKAHGIQSALQILPCPFP